MQFIKRIVQGRSFFPFLCRIPAHSGSFSPTLICFFSFSVLSVSPYCCYSRLLVDDEGKKKKVRKEARLTSLMLLFCAATAVAARL